MRARWRRDADDHCSTTVVVVPKLRRTACGCGGTHAKTRRRGPSREVLPRRGCPRPEDLHSSGRACDRKVQLSRATVGHVSPGAGSGSFSGWRSAAILSDCFRLAFPRLRASGRTGGWRDARPRVIGSVRVPQPTSKAGPTLGGRQFGLLDGSPPAWRFGHRPSSGRAPSDPIEDDGRPKAARPRHGSPPRAAEVQNTLVLVGRTHRVDVVPMLPLPAAPPWAGGPGCCGTGHPSTRTSISPPCSGVVSPTRKCARPSCCTRRHPAIDDAPEHVHRRHCPALARPVQAPLHPTSPPRQVGGPVATDTAVPNAVDRKTCGAKRRRGAIKHHLDRRSTGATSSRT